MDGGRVLRAVIWWVTGNATKATRAAAATGQFIAYGFIILGVLQFFSGAGFSGLWIAFIGWFLLSASQASSAQAELTEALKGVRVADLMRRDCTSVDGNTNLHTFVYEFAAPRTAVLSGRRKRGVQRPDYTQSQAIPQARWPLPFPTSWFPCPACIP
jgi:hypothetical protein